MIAQKKAKNVLHQRWAAEEPREPCGASDEVRTSSSNPTLLSAEGAVHHGPGTNVEPSFLLASETCACARGCPLIHKVALGESSAVCEPQSI